MLFISQAAAFNLHGYSTLGRQAPDLLLISQAAAFNLHAYNTIGRQAPNLLLISPFRLLHSVFRDIIIYIQLICIHTYIYIYI